MRIVILGGGLTGLSCAYELQKRNVSFLLVEKEKVLGGLCRSVKINGFTFDYTGHFLHFSNSNSIVKQYIEFLLKDNLIKIHRNAKIYTQYATTENKLIPYPFQANLFLLQPKISKQCLYDLIISQLENKKAAKNFKTWLIQNFGKSITRYFFNKYNTKLWKTSLEKITPSWAEKFVPLVDIEDILLKFVLGCQNKEYGYNVFFYYPKNGGIQALVDNIAKLVNKKNIVVGAEVVKIDCEKKKVFVLQNNKIESIDYDVLISTIPLVEFVKRSNLPKEIKLDIKKLNYTSVLCYNIAVKQQVMEGVHWIYFPERNTVFYRVGFYHNINKNLVKDECGSMYVEVALRKNEKVNDTELYFKIVKHLIETKIITSEKQIIFYNLLKIPYAYVVYDEHREKVLSYIFDVLNKHKVYSIGRYGGWKYSYMTENIKDAISTIERIL